MQPEFPDPAGEGASEGAAFKAVTQPGKRTPMAIAIAVVAVLALALLTKQLDSTANTPVASAAPTPVTAAALPSSTPSLTTATLAESGAPSMNPAVTPFPTIVAIAADAGTTQLIPARLTRPRLTISLPDGWQKVSDAVFVRPGGASSNAASSGGAAPVDLSIGAWSLEHVNTFPCRWSSGAYADGALMGTAEGQAEALSAWWGQDPGALPYWNSKIAPLATKPQPATIEGYPAWSLQVLIPSGLDLTQCDAGQLILWETATGDVRSSVPGEFHRLWVVDVDGQLIVIDAASSLVTSPDAAAELQSIIDSIVIQP